VRVLAVFIARMRRSLRAAGARAHMPCMIPWPVAVPLALPRAAARRVPAMVPGLWPARGPWLRQATLYTARDCTVTRCVESGNVTTRRQSDCLCALESGKCVVKCRVGPRARRGGGLSRHPEPDRPRPSHGHTPDATAGAADRTFKSILLSRHASRLIYGRVGFRKGTPHTFRQASCTTHSTD
jgi:hypothetical protein